MLKKIRRLKEIIVKTCQKKTFDLSPLTFILPFSLLFAAAGAIDF